MDETSTAIPETETTTDAEQREVRRGDRVVFERSHYHVKRITRQGVVELGGMPMVVTIGRFVRRADPDAVLEIREEEDQPTRCALAEFLVGNADDAELCARARQLPLGESFAWGGGAGVAFTVTRLE